MPASKEFFARFKNRLFVETGTHGGDGVAKALEAGVEHVYTIELSPEFYAQSQKRFTGDGRVSQYLGDSGCILGDVINTIHEPVTFWLDGHYSSCGTAKGPDMSPILRELNHIKSHPIKTHTILIDDVRLFGGVMFDFVHIGTVVEIIWSINPEYKLSLETGQPDLPFDILVATV